MPGPLAGYRVIDVTQMLSGPMATMMLGDQGAEVIKVEPPGTGDLTRKLGGKQRGLGPMFAMINRNKRSVTIDIATEAGRELVRALTVEADVLLENFRPGRLETRRNSDL